MEKRRHQRLDVRAQQRVVCFSTADEKPDRNVVITKNVSAEGFCFRSMRLYNSGDIFLAYLQTHFLADVQVEMPELIKSGNYVLARVLWCKPLTGDLDPFYEIGCTFVKKEEGDEDNLTLFTKLINHDTHSRIASNS